MIYHCLHCCHLRSTSRSDSSESSTTSSHKKPNWASKLFLCQDLIQSTATGEGSHCSTAETLRTAVWMHTSPLKPGTGGPVYMHVHLTYVTFDFCFREESLWDPPTNCTILIAWTKVVMH